MKISRKKMREWELVAAERGRRLKRYNLMKELSNCFTDYGKVRNESSRCPTEILSDLYMLGNAPKAR